MDLSQLLIEFSPVTILGLVLFGVMATIQIFYYVKYFFPLSTPEKTTSNKFTLPVSVVIAAKNEVKNIPKLIEHLLEQNYADFEIVIVNDYSEDGTWTLLQGLSSKRIKVLNNDGTSGKKTALQIGIKAAQHDYLLFTDADCLPNTQDWIQQMMNGFEHQKEIILGFGAFSIENSLLNRLIRLEGFMTAIQYFGFAKAGRPYMGVGRNLAYKKELLNTEVNLHVEVLSGDDDLLINQLATDKNVAIQMKSPAHTITEAEKTWKRFVLQKRRQLQAGSKYKKSDKVILAFFGASSFLYYVLFVTLLCNSPFTLVILMIFVLKQILEYLLLRGVAKELNTIDLLPFMSILEPLYILIMTTIGVSTWFWKVEKWK